MVARRYHYYNVYITHNGTATRLYFTDFLDLVRDIGWTQRLRKINFHPTALFDLTVPGQDQTARIAAIGKYRQNVKPYIGDINTDRAQMIQNDIIEMTTIVALPQARTVLVEYNFYGSKAKDIADYFNTFFATGDPQNQWAIYFDPIDSDKSIADVRASNDIREITLKMNAGSQTFDQLLARATAQNQRDTLFASMIQLIQTVKEETEAPVIELSFSKGRNRTLDLDAHQILHLVELLDIDNNDSVISCKVAYKNTATGKYETLELKNVGIRNDLVLEGDNGNHGWEFIGDKILEKYIEKGRPGSTNFVTKGVAFKDERMPRLLVVPRGEHVVPVQQGRREDLGGDTA
jgi:hypothetical protein